MNPSPLAWSALLISCAGCLALALGWNELATGFFLTGIALGATALAKLSRP